MWVIFEVGSVGGICKIMKHKKTKEVIEKQREIFWH
jgi:hypothetical protein